MTKFEELENKIRQAIPELKEEYEAFEDSSLDRDMITNVMLNHVMECFGFYDLGIDFMDGELLDLNTNDTRGLYEKYPKWNLKSPYLKDQSEGLINFLNEL